MIRRELYSSIISHLSEPEITILIWARQVGKSTLMSMCKDWMEQSGYQVVYMTLEKWSIKELLDQDPDSILQFLPSTKRSEKVIVCIDEIQYLKNPTSVLKYIYDVYKDRIKLFVTWSSAFYIDHHFKDSLAGRKKIFTLYPLSFSEFLDSQWRADLINFLHYPLPKQHSGDLYAYFSEYCMFWWYPRLALYTNYNQKKEYIDDLVHTYIKKDIMEAQVTRPDVYLNIMKLLAEQTGKLVNMSELANRLWVSLTLIKSYLYTMQVSFHIALCKPYFNSIRKEIIKMPKVYFFDHGIRNYLLNNYGWLMDRQDKWEILENEVYKQLCYHLRDDKIQFRRSKDEYEMDFVVDKRYAIEVKTAATQKESKSQKKFEELYPHIPYNTVYLDQIIASSYIQ